jgi:hypothetical protein
MTLISKLGGYNCGMCGSRPRHLSPKGTWTVTAVSSSTSANPDILCNGMGGPGPQDACYGQGSYATHCLAGDKSCNIGRADPGKRIHLVTGQW